MPIVVGNYRCGSPSWNFFVRICGSCRPRLKSCDGNFICARCITFTSNPRGGSPRTCSRCRSIFRYRLACINREDNSGNDFSMFFKRVVPSGGKYIISICSSRHTPCPRYRRAIYTTNYRISNCIGVPCGIGYFITKIGGQRANTNAYQIPHSSIYTICG